MTSRLLSAVALLTLAGCSAETPREPTAQDRCVAYVRAAQDAVNRLSGVSPQQAREQAAKDKGVFSREYRALDVWLRSITPMTTVDHGRLTTVTSPGFDLRAACSD